MLVHPKITNNKIFISSRGVVPNCKRIPRLGFRVLRVSVLVVPVLLVPFSFTVEERVPRVDIWVHGVLSPLR